MADANHRAHQAELSSPRLPGNVRVAFIEHGEGLQPADLIRTRRRAPGEVSERARRFVSFRLYNAVQTFLGGRIKMDGTCPGLRPAS